MRIHIIIPYRPLSHNAIITPSGKMDQLPDGRWRDTDGSYKFSGHYRRDGEGSDELIRAIRYLNKNSYYKHHIVIVIDHDVYPDVNYYFSKFDNVEFIQSKYVHQGPLQTLAITRLNAALKYGIDNITNEDWLCYSYISDLICGKHWDKPVIDAIQKYGEKYVYVPMFTEIRGGMGNKILIGLEPTNKLIWEEWRKTISCHALTMPEPASRYFTEADMDKFIRVATEVKRDPIVEKPGDRIYGYFAVLFMKAKYGKKAMRLEGPAFDLSFDHRLYTESGLKKMVIPNSFVFHPFCPLKE